MNNVLGNHTPKDPRFYQKVNDALNSCNNSELARLGFLELGMDPTEWRHLSDVIAGDRTGSKNSIVSKINLCTTGFKNNKPINLGYVADVPEQFNWTDVKEGSALSDSFQTEKFKLRYNTAKENLEDRKLSTAHIDVAKRYLESKNENPELFHNFKYYWRDHESQESLLTTNIFMRSMAVTLVAAVVGGVCKSQLLTKIEEAHNATGRTCSDLNKISSANLSGLRTSNVYKAGQCIEVAAQQEQFYGAVEHNVFWANASMAVGCAGMAVMIVSGIALIRGLSNSGKN